VCVCVCLCVCVRERERECVCVSVCMFVVIQYDMTHSYKRHTKLQLTPHIHTNDTCIQHGVADEVVLWCSHCVTHVFNTFTLQSGVES